MLGHCLSSTKIINRLDNGYDYSPPDMNDTLWQAFVIYEASVLLSSI